MCVSVYRARGPGPVGGPDHNPASSIERMQLERSMHDQFLSNTYLVGQTQRWPGLQVLIHPDEAALVEGATGTMTPGEPVRVGGLEVTPLHTPGHTRGMLSLLVEGNVFTGDTLFKNSVGGVRAPGSTSYE